MIALMMVLEILKEKISKKVDKIFYHDKNLGKEQQKRHKRL